MGFIDSAVIQELTIGDYTEVYELWSITPEWA
jgi:hypothetical protein